MKASQLALAALRASANGEPAGAGAFEATAWDESLSFDGATTWLNTQPLTMAGLRGNVVLVNFWTYTCINWLRSLPYVRAWAARYRDHGLVVIGVHSPEFAFERDVDNVRLATRSRGIGYPVAVDSDHAVWRSFANRYWPALYLIDADGHLRHHQFGEGEYAESEMTVQRTLMEAGRGDIHGGLTAVEAGGVEAPADWANLWSPEQYLGYVRTDNVASPGGLVPDERSAYTAPDRLDLNHWALAGDWTAYNDAVALHEAGGRIATCFHARDLHLVMGPPGPEPVRFRVLLNGQSPGSSHGVDVDAQGRGVAAEQRLYQLIRQPGAVADGQFTIEFEDPGVEAYAFTFG